MRAHASATAAAASPVTWVQLAIKISNVLWTDMRTYRASAQRVAHFRLTHDLQPRGPSLPHLQLPGARPAGCLVGGDDGVELERRAGLARRLAVRVGEARRIGVVLLPALVRPLARCLTLRLNLQ